MFQGILLKIIWISRYKHVDEYCHEEGLLVVWQNLVAWIWFIPVVLSEYCSILLNLCCFLGTDNQSRAVYSNFAVPIQKHTCVAQLYFRPFIFNLQACFTVERCFLCPPVVFQIPVQWHCYRYSHSDAIACIYFSFRQPTWIDIFVRY